MIEICENKNCKFGAVITTNGYLLNDEIIEKLAQAKVDRMQITVDGPKVQHNSKRPLAGGTGTFDVIMCNINKVLAKDIFVTLRSNVDEENIDSINELYDMIPIESRKKVRVDICNLYQNKDRKNSYETFKVPLIRDILSLT